MEEGTAEMTLPPTHPEIKELWMGPGRRRACTHTKKSPPPLPVQSLMLMISHAPTHAQGLRIKGHAEHKLERIRVIASQLFGTRC